jgi:hypothetical protein
MYLGTAFLSGYTNTISYSVNDAMLYYRKQKCILCPENDTTGFFGCSSAKMVYNGYNKSSK